METFFEIFYSKDVSNVNNNSNRLDFDFINTFYFQ